MGQDDKGQGRSGLQTVEILPRHLDGPPCGDVLQRGRFLLELAKHDTQLLDGNRTRLVVVVIHLLLGADIVHLRESIQGRLDRVWNGVHLVIDLQDDGEFTPFHPRECLIEHILHATGQQKNLTEILHRRPWVLRLRWVRIAKRIHGDNGREDKHGPPVGGVDVAQSSSILCQALILMGYGAVEIFRPFVRVAACAGQMECGDCQNAVHEERVG